MSISRRRALFGFVVLLASATVFLSSGFLPERVAANFRPDGMVASYNSRDTYRNLMTLLTLLVPLITFVALARLPRGRFFFLPNRAYWFSAEHRASTLAWIERFGLVTSAWISIFLVGMHTVILQANRLTPPRFELWPRVGLGIAWLVFLVTSGVVFHQHFRRLT